MLTLPPVVGQRYTFQYDVNFERDPFELHECTITETEEWLHALNPSSTNYVYRASCSDGNSWVFWPDGEAKRSEDCPVCHLVADIVEDLPVSAEFAELQATQEERMNKLRELGV